MREKLVGARRICFHRTKRAIDGRCPERAAKRLTEVDTAGKAWWVLLTPSGQVGLGEFGAHTLYDPATFNALVQLPARTGTTNGADIAWSPDYRYAAYGTTGGHGGLC